MNQTRLFCTGLGLLFLLSPILLVLPGCEESSNAKFESFSESFDDAVAESQATGRPLMVLFTGSDWCPPCMALEREVLSTSEFKTWANENVVLMLVDQPRHKKLDSATREQNERLSNKYGISGVPTVLFLNGEQEVVGTLGYRPGGPKSWIDAADDILVRAN